METLASGRQEGGGRLVIRKETCGRSHCPDSSAGSFPCQLCAFESSHDLGGCAYS